MLNFMPATRVAGQRVPVTESATKKQNTSDGFCHIPGTKTDTENPKPQ